MQSEVRPAVLVRPAVECSAVRSDAALDHNSELIADVSSPLIQCLPPDSAATVQQPLQLPSCRQELYLMSTPKASLSNALHFHDGGPEEDLKVGESSMDRQTSQASTLTLTAVDLSCSPVSLMSPDSQPRSCLFDVSDVSHYCIAKLFNQSLVYQNITVLLSNKSVLLCLAGLHQPQGNFVLTFRDFGHVIYEED